ncbi:hypothetical protein VPH35_082849 [Triticum aestivum]
MTKVAALKKALAEAKDKVAKERASCEKHEARVDEAQQQLQGVIERFESLERNSKVQESELEKARQSAQDARAEAQNALQEIQAVKNIVAGESFTMQSNVSYAAEHYRAEEGMSTEKLFWSQYLGPEHPVPFSDQLKQLVELHKSAELAMKDLIVRLWPAEPIPRSYFGLVQRLVSACLRLETVKRSVCIEGARMTFARVKTHWAKLDAKKLMTEGPLEGKEHRRPEHYFDGVLEGSRLVAEQCSKDIIFP